MSDQQWVFGVHAVTAVLKNRNRQVHSLYIDATKSDKSLETIRRLAEQYHVSVLPIDSVSKKFANQTHQGIIASVASITNYHEADLPTLLSQCGEKDPFILILDGITDVHNLGACLRTADAAGVDFVVMAKDKSAPVNATVSKVASGAAESVPIVRVTNLSRSIKTMQDAGVWIYGADGHASQSLYQLDCRGPIAIVMGSEGKGLRRLTTERCDNLFALPMHGYVESLNVSVATGISLYEVVRQRQATE